MIITVFINELTTKRGSGKICILFLMWRSVTKAEIPDDWRLANVIPIYEKGWKEGLKNYKLR